MEVVIPALDEERNIILSLDSIKKQTLQPERVVLVDDGSNDRTAAVADEYAKAIGLNLVVYKRQAPIGKTVTLKRQSRESDADVEFILDGDTALESPNYIERLVFELYQGVGIASACGTILPIKTRARKALFQEPKPREFLKEHPQIVTELDSTWYQRLSRKVISTYRDCLYRYLQRFIYHGEMVFFGSIVNPVGCAVAYRRKYVKELFDEYEPVLGENLTTSEDIFIGFAMADYGYRNIQLADVYARTLEPRFIHWFHQQHNWSSSFLQSCYYFPGLLWSPFKALKRWRWRRRSKKSGVEELRRIKEQYRQAFGRQFTKQYGRPIGWFIFLSAFEKLSFPLLLILMLAMGWWEALLVTLAAETGLFLFTLFVTSKSDRFSSLLKGILITPFRYTSIIIDIVTTFRFFWDVLVTKNRDWRK
ncbi:glycosyltransferase [Desulfoferula mesophila]|uniref:glycosyltransferase n=1 Tax=Desulfoferula mesophila TaxID=3058419 RepID=UPI0030CB90D5